MRVRVGLPTSEPSLLIYLSANVSIDHWIYFYYFCDFVCEIVRFKCQVPFRTRSSTCALVPGTGTARPVGISPR